MNILRSSTASGSTEASKRTSSKANERKEQYKQVRAHVKKEDGRMQAYGWSLPAQQKTSSASAASTPTGSDDSSSSSKIGTNVPVPVPVYCRPLMEKEPGMKVRKSHNLFFSGNFKLCLHAKEQQIQATCSNLKVGKIERPFS